MSSIEELQALGLLKGKELENLKRRARRKAEQLKTLRAFYDRRARIYFKKWEKAGRPKRWKGLEHEQKMFRMYMSKRHKLHESIARLVPEPVEPEWDSP